LFSNELQRHWGYLTSICGISSPKFSGTINAISSFAIHPRILRKRIREYWLNDLNNRSHSSGTRGTDHRFRETFSLKKRIPIDKLKIPFETRMVE
jgi:hypothetical protein